MSKSDTRQQQIVNYLTKYEICSGIFECEFKQNKNSNLAVKTAKHENSEKSNLSGHYSREWNECLHVNHSFLNRVQQIASGNAPSQYSPDTISWTLFRCSLRG